MVVLYTEYCHNLADNDELTELSIRQKKDSDICPIFAVLLLFVCRACYPEPPVYV